ncbi:hypothetical protein [Sphingobium fuliginis]|uniref:Uncharacterized protein n=1 Tax=Sphingobium fuliginis ATCC 27551 TaxID=1208342 RepID=A0A5B8CGX2_SPHSA|nr:hypothetical protein [Sphingobium fuliginis]QDC37277.1 hypothetical protein FIL70_08640 [Sphingobium fuliginis ATCC 27551]
MSDGPYKSLPMKPRWRRAAKCAYKEAYSAEEIAESVARASHADWRSEVRPALVGSVTAIVNAPGQQFLFADQALADLGALQRSCASPMEAMLVRTTIDAVRAGMTGTAAVQQAAEDTLSDRVLCNYRQVEEHVRRDDNVQNARFVRDRFATAHGQVDFGALARALLKTGDPLPRQTRSAHTDLDAGVPL